jgi:hypothetical protein
VHSFRFEYRVDAGDSSTQIHNSPLMLFSPFAEGSIVIPNYEEGRDFYQLQ